MRYEFQGTEERFVVGHFPETALEAARRAVQGLREDAAKGINPKNARPQRRRVAAAVVVAPNASSPHSIESVAADFMSRFVTPHRKRPEYVQRIIDTDILKVWRGRDARTIRPVEVINLLDGIADRGSPTMANRTAAILTQLFKYAVHRQLVEVSPVQLLFRPGGPEKPRDRSLSDVELASLLKCIDDVMIRARTTVHVIRIALYTACRRSELCLAKWSELRLDGDSPLWRIPPANSKTGIEYLIPLVPAAVKEFRKLKDHAGRSAFVIPNAAADGPIEPRLITRSIARHLETLAEHGVQAFTLHDLRRTVRTGLARLRVQPHIAERVLNHAQPGIAAVYDVHAYQEEKRDALDKWAAHLEALKTAKLS